MLNTPFRRLNVSQPLGFSISSWLCFIFLFLNALPRTTAATNILIGLLAISTATLTIKKKLLIDWRSPISLGVISFVALAFVSSALSPYWQESLQPLRREILPFALVYILLTGNRADQDNREHIAKATIWALIGSYIARIALASMDWSIQGFQHDSYTINREAAQFVDFFAVTSPLFLPLVIVALLYWPISKAWKLMLSACTIISFALIGIAGVRTALLCAIVVSLYQITPFVWRKKWVILACTVILGAVSFVYFKPQIERNLPKYVTIIQPSTYKENYSLVERYAIWRSTLEMVETRPLLGYGMGWKKLHDVAYKEGFYANWQTRHDWLDEWAIRYFDTTGYGGSNPHNSFVQLLFETGALGLMAFLSILISTGVIAFKTRGINGVAWLWPCVSASLLAYLIINLMNGLWLASGVVVGLAVATELTRQARSLRTFEAVS